MLYALWDLRLGNQLGVFPTEEQALATVRKVLAAAIPEEDLALEREVDDGDGTFVAEGEALAELAVRNVARQRHVP
jgi:hypothetical protein